MMLAIIVYGKEIKDENDDDNLYTYAQHRTSYIHYRIVVVVVYVRLCIFTK